jgi:uncharacterized membrane protein
MTNILRFLEVFALGTWVGGIIFLSFVVAPGVFGTVSSRDQAGAVVGLALSRLHILGMIAGIVYLIAAVALARSVGGLVRPAALAVILMVLLTFVSQNMVSAKMRRLREEMVSVDATPRENPLRIEFDRLHRVSVHLEGSVLLLGLIALFFTVRSKTS